MATSTSGPARSRRASATTSASPITSRPRASIPKAAALYKKIIKFKPGEESALLQLGDIAARQGLLADAKQYFNQLADRRKARGDHKGAAELSVRVGTLDPDDLDARLMAARAAAGMGDAATALREFREVAQRLSDAGKDDARIDVLAEVAALDPDDLETLGDAGDGVRGPRRSRHAPGRSCRR